MTVGSVSDCFGFLCIGSDWGVSLYLSFSSVEENSAVYSSVKKQIEVNEVDFFFSFWCNFFLYIKLNAAMYLER